MYNDWVLVNYGELGEAEIYFEETETEEET